jgi:uncharacterized protein (UPF0335 family)
MKTLSQRQAAKQKREEITWLKAFSSKERANEIKAMSLEDWAAERGIAFQSKNRRLNMPTKRQLMEQVETLEDENQELQDTLDDVAEIATAPGDQEKAETLEDLAEKLDEIVEVVAPEEEEGEEEEIEEGEPGEE